jgi:hypothetical protein
VSKTERLARLNRLLEQVRTRARARDGLSAGGAQAIAEPSAPEPVEEPVQLSTWTPPPPDDPVPEIGIAVDVDYVETTQISVADSVAENSPSSHLDSTERLVAAGTAPTYSAGDEGSDRPAPHPAEPSADAERAMRSAPGAFEDEVADPEPAPASSRRPVTLEPEDRLEQIAFGADEARPPLHTPPPESGRVPAAHAGDYDSDSPPMGGDGHPNEPLLAQATRAVLPSFATVAELTGDPSRSMPVTFSAILDDTLAL